MDPHAGPQEQVARTPCNGYYAAAYACPVGELGREYVAYYKLFSVAPDSYFDDGGCLLKGLCEVTYTDPLLALSRAIDQAQRQAVQLPPADALAERWDWRPGGTAPAPLA